ncbi:uncharacterized protein LOC131951743 [Physella acuta]|uniref:uncharacterized protein LOC131951743 n=1 Tax=Physella acuta TaxID=109671 RepID=UPI0027DD7078|nr:uncharacterized protein LOC131951743 [Physella acuta]
MIPRRFVVAQNLVEFNCHLNYTIPPTAPFQFDIQGNTVIFEGGRLSAQTTPTYEIGIICSALNESFVAHPKLTVNIINLPPTFVHTGKYVNLTLDSKHPYPVGSGVFNATATDPEHDLLTYSIIYREPMQNIFSIDNNGMMTTKFDLRTLAENYYRVDVEVKDNHNNRNNLTIVFTIVLNLRPQITNLPSEFFIPENTIGSRSIIILNVYDDDNDLFCDCKVEPSSEFSKFEFNGAAREVKVVQALDYESVSIYTITCRLFDKFLYSQPGILTVRVVNVNEPPYFLSQNHLCILNEGPAGMSCDPGVVLRDPEGDAVTSATFTANNNYLSKQQLPQVNLTSATFTANNNYLRFDVSTKRIAFSQDYDVDTITVTSFRLQLMVSDVHGAASKPVDVTVIINDVNDNTCRPPAVRAYFISQQQRPETLGTLPNTDSDLTSPNKDVIYSDVIGEPYESLRYFTVTRHGAIVYKEQLPETSDGKSYILAFKCKDGGSPQRTADVTIVFHYMLEPTTTTPTTTTTTTTTTQSTTKAVAKKNVFDDSGFVVVFVILISILGVALLVGIYFLLRHWGVCTGSSALANRKTQDSNVYASAREVRTVQPFFNKTTRVNQNFKDDYWRTGDNFATGIGYTQSRDVGSKHLELPASHPQTDFF